MLIRIRGSGSYYQSRIRMKRYESGPGTYPLNVQKHAIAKDLNLLFNLLFNLDFNLHLYNFRLIFIISFLSYIS